ncbi:MAG: hypothetical protein EA366_01005 [Spirulina sp. DLM2.Bin59]|nr:MAG: hypothetical protein EA366_01005 [Spirulina sp. DLM2.Bin59]
MNYWQKAIAIALSSTLGLSGITAAIAQSSPMELAQMGDLTGECRQVNQRIAVYATRGGNEIVTTLERGAEVIIDEPMALAGRIAIRLPINGFIPTGILANCNTVLPDVTNPIGPICINHRVDPRAGLPIHISPSSQSQVRDRLFPRERITVVGNPTLDNSTGIEWLRISHPFEGWIENGNPNSRNFNTTPCNELGL